VVSGPAYETASVVTRVTTIDNTPVGMHTGQVSNPSILLDWNRSLTRTTVSTAWQPSRKSPFKETHADCPVESKHQLHLLRLGSICSELGRVEVQQDHACCLYLLLVIFIIAMYAIGRSDERSRTSKILHSPFI
jgi:hypothetical protein